MFWRKKPTYTPPPPPKPMVARFSVYLLNGYLSHDEEYDGRHIWDRPCPYVSNGMVRVGTHWINLDQIERIEVRYEGMPNA
jgi:hypothetical protein